MARPRGKTHEPTSGDLKYVEALSSYGVPEDDIARVVGISRMTLRKHYADQLENGATRANAQVAGFLFGAAKKGSVPAMMFWLRCRAKWSDASALSALGKKEERLAQAQQPDLSSPVGEVLAAREQRHLGSELSGLARPSVAWPVADTRTAA